MPYTPILATLGYVISPDRTKVLMVHRNARPDDAHFGKYNGLGGKLERDEDIVAGMKRELSEEAGIEPTKMTLKDTIRWPGFGKGGEDWFGFLFLIQEFEGEAKSRCPEGTLEWVALDRVMDLPMWEGDRNFLPMVLNVESPIFHGVMPYQDGKPIRWTCT